MSEVTLVKACEDMPLCGVKLGELRLGEGVVVIRGACSSDRDRILEFLESLDEESIYERFYHVIKDFRPYVDSLIKSRSVVVIAELNGRVVGMAEAIACRKDYVEVGFIVARELRGKGIGSLLCRVLGEACQALGFKGIIAYVKRYNVPALKIARKLGATVRQGPEPDTLLVEACFENSNL